MTTWHRFYTTSTVFLYDMQSATLVTVVLMWKYVAGVVPAYLQELCVHADNVQVFQDTVGFRLYLPTAWNNLQVQSIAGVKLRGIPRDLRSSTSDVRSLTSSLIVWYPLPFGRFYYITRCIWCFCSFLMVCHGFLVPCVHCTRADERNTVHCSVIVN